MLNDFQAVLAADKSLSQKHVPHYIRWVRDCYNYLRLPVTERLSQDQDELAADVVRDLALLGGEVDTALRGFYADRRMLETQFATVRRLFKGPIVPGSNPHLESLERDSLHYGMLMRKYQIETYRREVPSGGYVVSVIRDGPMRVRGTSTTRPVTGFFQRSSMRPVSVSVKKATSSVRASKASALERRYWLKVAPSMPIIGTAVCSGTA